MLTMKNTEIKAMVKPIAALSALLAASIPAAGAGEQVPEIPPLPALEITRAEIEEAAPRQFRLVMELEGVHGGEPGWYSVRVDRRPPGAEGPPGYNLPGPPLPGFYRHSSRDGIHPVELEMLNNNPEGDPDSRVAANGPLDEDPRPGAFAYTFDARDWEDGEYVFRVMAGGPDIDGHRVRSERRFVGFLLGDARPAAELVNVPDAEHREIYKHRRIYAAFPRLHTLPDGRIAISHSTRIHRSHIDTTGGSAQWVSPDEGLTWEPLDQPLIDECWLTEDGRVVRPESEGWIYVDAAREPALRAAGKRIHSRPTHDGRIAYMGGARVRVSTDGGRTWTYERIPLPEDDPPMGLSGYSTAASYLLTSDGVRIRVMSGSRRDPRDPDEFLPSEIYFLRSEDDGDSWECIPMRPEGLPDGHPGLNETALVETRDGRLLAMSRSASATSRDGYLWQSESIDGGRTWTGPVRTGIWGFPAHVLRLDGNRLICAYGYRRDPMGIRAVISEDGGRTWDLENELILRADGWGHAGDNGMPLLYRRSDGRLIAIYYITDRTGITHVASTIFQAPEGEQSPEYTPIPLSDAD